MEPSPSSSSGTQISRFSFSSASSSSGERRLSVASETISLNETSSSIALQPSPSSLGDMASVLSGSASKENSLLPSQFHQGDYVSSTLKNAQKMYALMEAYCGTNNNSGGASLGMGMGTHPAGGTYYPPYFTNNNTPESGNGDMSGASLYRQTSLNGTTVPHHLQQQQQQPIIMAKSASVSSGVSHASSMRTVYLGNLPPLLTYEALLNNIQVGVIEHIKLFEEKNCAFLTFVEASVAAQFMMEYSPPPGSSIPANKFVLQGRDIKIGWGKNTLPSETLLLAVKNGASRHVLVSNVPDSLLGLETIETTFSMFGPIDQIRLSPERNVVSVHLISITAAIKAIVTLSMDPTWAQCRIQYGRDRCVPGDDSNHGLAAQVDPASTQSHQTQQQQPSMGLARPAPHVSIGGVSPWQLSAGPVNGDVHQRYSSPPVSHHYQQQSLSGYGGNNVAGQMGRGLLYQSSMHQANNTEQTPFGEQTYQMSQQNQHGSAPSLSINTNMQAPYGFPNHVSNGHAHTYSSSPTGSLGNGQPVSASMSNGAPSPVSQFPNWMGNRTVYLGGIHPDVTTKDLCDVRLFPSLVCITWLTNWNRLFEEGFCRTSSICKTRTFAL